MINAPVHSLPLPHAGEGRGEGLRFTNTFTPTLSRVRERG